MVPAWIPVAIALVALVVIALFLKKGICRNEEFGIAKRDLAALRTFFNYYHPTEMVESVLAGFAARMDEAFKKQVELQCGWIMPENVDPADKEQLSAIFATELAHRNAEVRLAKDFFWWRVKVAREAADATYSDLNYFGVGYDKKGWKDFLPTKGSADDIGPGSTRSPRLRID